MNSIVKIPDYTLNSLELSRVKFMEDYFSMSEDNDFIPIWSLTNGDLVIKPTGEKHFLYNLTTPVDRVAITTKLSYFAENLFSNRAYEWKVLHHSTIKRRYYSHNGILLYIQDSPFKVVPLMVLAVKKRYLFSIDKNNTDISHYCLLIDNKLLEDDEHFKLYRNIKKHYLSVISKDIDVMYSNDITKLCYNQRKLDIPKFTTITQTIEYLRGLNDVLLSNL